MIGTVKGYEVRKNCNSAHPVIMLKVQLEDPEDIQSIELYSPAGEKTIPEDDSRVVIFQITSTWKVAIAVDDHIDPSDLNDGEKKLYSLDHGVEAATITLTNTGDVLLNGDSDFAVRYTALNTALANFIIAVNAALATKLDGAGAPGALTLDISAAKVEDVKVS
jgi:hypothetical protein